MNMDVRTLAMVLGITHLVQVVVFSLHAAVNKTYKGVNWWLLWSVSAVVGFVFVLLRDIPSIHLFSIVAQNFFITLAVTFLYIGILRFLDKRENPVLVVSILAVFLVVIVYFTYIYDDIAFRNVFICVYWAGISFLTAQALLANKMRSVNASANFLTTVFVAHGFFFLIRTIAALDGLDPHNMFIPSMFNLSAYLDGIIASLLWTCGVIIMVNQRSNADMAEAKEHFELIFNTSPDASLITRLTDGMIVDANEGFMAMTGFSRDEVVGRSSLDIAIWKYPADRQKVVAELVRNGFCDNFESTFLRKDGSEITGILSGKTITLRGAPHIISVTRDISGRKQAEEEIARARRHEAQTGHSIQKTLLTAELPTEVTGVSTFAVSVPSKVVDGDFHDFFPHNSRCFDLVAADVMGKGVAAALMGAATKTQFLRVLASHRSDAASGKLPSVESIVSSVHRQLTPDLAELESFVTLVYGRFDLDAGEFTYVDCGHTATIHFNAATGECEFLKGLNVPLGCSLEERYRSASASFSPGDIFLFYSDGVTDAQNAAGECLSPVKLAKAVVEMRGGSARQLVERVIQDVRDFTGRTQALDDVTCVAVKIDR